MQIDHMTYVRDGQTVKEFRAICPVTKFMTTRVYSRATAGNARRFLMDLLETLPFPLLSIQVDGGSEFMAQFENACEQLRSATRPAAPQATVERLRRTSQSLRTDRVLEPLRRPADHQAGRPTPGQLRILLQLPAPSCIAGLPDAQRIHYRLGGRLVLSAKGNEPVQSVEKAPIAPILALKVAAWCGGRFFWREFMIPMKRHQAEAIGTSVGVIRRRSRRRKGGCCDWSSFRRHCNGGHDSSWNHFRRIVRADRKPNRQGSRCAQGNAMSFHMPLPTPASLVLQAVIFVVATIVVAKCQKETKPTME